MSTEIPRRVFFADANVTVHSHVLRVLDAANFQTTSYAEGISALNRLESQPGSYDVIIVSTDLGHGIHGIDFIRKVRERTSYDQTPIFLLTGHTPGGIQITFGLKLEELKREYGVDYVCKDEIPRLPILIDSRLVRAA